MNSKTIQSSRSTISGVMLPMQANPSGNVHGGEIMKMMDVAASVAAFRHARTNVVTLRVDELIFHLPIYVGQLVTCNASLVFVGHSSMEILVEVMVEDLEKDEPPRLAQTAFFTFVGLDKYSKTTKVPELALETVEEKIHFEQGRKRYEGHKKKIKNI